MANLWATLGPLTFGLLEAPEELAMVAAEDYAESPRIQDKPRLQWIGTKLRELRFKLLLHPLFGDPEARLEALLKASHDHVPLDLVLGNGQNGKPFAGKYVITETPVTLRQQLEDGQILLMEVEVVLKEWVEDQVLEFKRQQGPARSKAGAKKSATPKGGGYPTSRNPYTPQDATRQPK